MVSLLQGPAARGGAPVTGDMALLWNLGVVWTFQWGSAGTSPSVSVHPDGLTRGHCSSDRCPETSCLRSGSPQSVPSGRAASKTHGPWRAGCRCGVQRLAAPMLGMSWLCLHAWFPPSG